MADPGILRGGLELVPPLPGIIDHRFSRDTEMPSSDIIVFKRNYAVARLAVYIG